MEPLSVLLIDDEPTYRQILKQFLLDQHGIGTVHTANNGQEALNRAALHEPDLVLVDLFMPVLSSLDAIPRLRELLPETTGLIALSIQDDEAYRKAAIEAGADAFVSKMDAATHLLPAVRRVVQERKPFRNPPSTSSEDGDRDALQSPT